MPDPLPRGTLPALLVTRAASRRRAALIVSGSDRASFLTRVMSGDLPKQEGAAPTALLGPRGNVISAGIATVLRERILLETDPPRGSALLWGLDRYRIADDVALTSEDPADTGGRGVRTTVEGPGAAEALDRALLILAGAAPAPSPNGSRSVRDLAPGGVRILAEDATGFACVRRDFRPWKAYTVLSGPGAAGAARIAAIEAQLRRTGARFLSEAEADYLRIAAGEPAWGAEMGGRSLPLGCGLAAHVRLGKGCYIGQEYVARQAHRGRIPRLLRVLECAAGDAPAPGARVAADADGRPVGEVTSSAPAPPGFPTPAFALAILAAGVAPGAAVTIGAGGPAPVAATVRNP